MTKYCKKCDANHSVESFAKDRTKPDGLQAYCKKSNNEYQAGYRVKNPQKREYLAEYRKRNPDRYKKWAKRTDRNGQRRTPEGRIKRQEDNRRRRALKLKLPSEKYTRNDIEQRDGSVSWVTGETSDTTDTKAVHVDHLIPLAYYIPGHPGDVLDNVAFCEADRNIGRNYRLTSQAMQQYVRNVVLNVPDVTELGDVLAEVK